MLHKHIKQNAILALTLVSLLTAPAFAKSKQEQLDAKAQEASLEDIKKNWKRAKAADQIRLQTITSIQSMMTRNISDDQKFELYLRLGELFGERSDYLRKVEIFTWEQRFDTWNKTKQGVAPTLDHTVSKRELLKAAASFRRLVHDYPNHARVDAALFSLAKSLDELDNPKALAYYTQLIRNYPNSPLMPQAYLALGEYEFARNKFKSARAYYQRASKYKGTKFYAYVIYKLGWSYYNSDGGSDSQQNKLYAKALSAFKLTVRLSDRNRKYQGLDLRREAINDLVMVWSEIEGVTDAFAFFSKMGEMEAFYDVLEKLGNTYADQGQNQKAIATFERLLGEAPHRERTPETYIKLIGLRDQVGDLKALIHDFQRLYLTVNGQSTWAKAHASNRELRKEAAEKVEKQLHRYGALFHQRGQKTKNPVFLNTAMHLYKYYLEKFPKQPIAYEIRYYLADIYYDFKMYSAASDEYLQVALAGAKGKFHKDAALNAVAAMSKLVEGTKWDPLPPLGEVKSPVAIPTAKQKLVKVIDIFVKLLPQEKEGQPMRITAAKIFFTHGHYPEALNRFERIALEIPHTKEGKVSLETIMNFHTKHKQWFDVIGKSRKYLATKALSQGEHKVTITNYLKNAVYKLAIAYDAGKQHLKAANTFLAFQKEFPSDTAADKALFNASQNFFAIDLVDEALNTGRLLLQSYPKSKLVPDVNLNIAQTYEGIANYGEAANFFALFAKTYPTDSRSANALYNAATLYKGLKQYEVSLQHYSQFTQRYSNHPFVADAIFEMASIFEKINRHQNAVQAYDSYLTAATNINLERQLMVKAKAALIMYQKVDKNQGFSRLNDLRIYLQSSKQVGAFEARRLVAKTFFEQLASRVAQFRQIKIRSAKTLESDVKAKQSILLNMAQNFENIIAIGSGEYVVASLYQLGQLHENFSDDLFNAPDPIAADQKTIDDYRSSIEQVAFPLKEEAFKYYETAYKRSGEVATFTEWTKKAYEKMAFLFPERHPEIMEKEAKPAYLSQSLYATDDVDGLIE